MKALVQRVTWAKVRIDDEIVGSIADGLLVFLGITHDDTLEHARWLAEKLVALRIFADDAGKMNLSLNEVNGSMLIVSQFTLYGDCQKGRRPSFVAAAPPPIAIPLYEAFQNEVKALGIPIATGRFGADMKVELLNDGPVTLMIESK